MTVAEFVFSTVSGSGLIALKWFVDLFRLNFTTPFARRESMFKLAQLAVLFVVFAIIVWIPVRWLGSPGTNQIRLEIKDATALSVEAPVVMLGMEIGHVESVGLEDGRAIAMLEIDGQWTDEIPGGSEFVIASLNSLLPGNVGVQILPPADDAPDTAINLVNGIRSEVASDRLIPRQTPIGMFVALGIGVLVFAIALGIAIKVAKSSLVINVVVAGVLAFISFLVVKGVIPVDTTPLRAAQKKVQDKIEQVIQAPDAPPDASSTAVPLPEGISVDKGVTESRGKASK